MISSDILDSVDHAFLEGGVFRDVMVGYPDVDNIFMKIVY